MESRAALPYERWAGRLLLRAGPALAGFAVLTSIGCAVLVPVGGWRPVVVAPLLLVAVAALVPLARVIPTHPVPVWTALASLAVAAGHGWWAASTHAEHVVLRRDAGSYALFAQWIATRHGLPVDPSAQLFGGADAARDPSFTFASPAYYEVVGGGSVTVVPQFLIGAPALYSLGYWLDGWPGLFVAPAVVSAAAVLAFAGLAARISGPRSAPLAAAALALTQPVLHAARSTYSEPAALLILMAAGSVLVAALRAEPDGPAGALAAAAGAGFGAAGLVRVDALREVILLLPVAAVLWLRGRLTGRLIARPLLVGASVGTGASAAAAVGLSRPYLADIAGSLLPLLALGVVLAVGSALAVRFGTRRGVAAQPVTDHPPVPACQTVTARQTAVVGPPRSWHRPALLWPVALWPVALATVFAVLATRPWWLVVRQSPRDPGSRVVAGLQLRQGLPVDGGRTYAEQSLGWVAWYVGPVTLLAAGVVLVWAANRAGRWWSGPPAELPGWLPVALVGVGSCVLTLYRPGITPDHPWADRRLVPVVLPVVILAAVAGLAAVSAWARARWSVGVFAAVPLAGVVALLVPAWLGTAAVATARTERGQLAAARHLCEQLRPGDVVIGVDTRARNEWPQLVRGVCGYPAGSFQGPEEDVAAALPRVLERVRAAGGRPVLIAANDSARLTALGLSARQVVSLDTTEDQRYLTRRPDGVDPLDVDLWLARP